MTLGLLYKIQLAGLDFKAFSYTQPTKQIKPEFQMRDKKNNKHKDGTCSKENGEGNRKTKVNYTFERVDVWSRHAMMKKERLFKQGEVEG